MSELKKIDPLSHSKTVSYINCERKFSFNYLESIKEPSGIHAAVGTFVHSVIEEFYKNEMSKNPYFEWKNSSNYLFEVQESLWEKHQKYLTYLYEKEKVSINNSFQSLEEWINQLIINYVELEDWIQNESNLSNLKFSQEEKFIKNLKINNELYVKKELNDKEVSFVLRGYIDRLQESETGKKIIIDIKTGKPPSSLDSEKADQIKSYALLYGEENVEEGYVYFLGEKNIKPEKRIFQVEIKDIDDNKKYYLKTFGSMSRKSEYDKENYAQDFFTDVWKAKMNPFCNWCFYKNGCPEWAKVYQQNEFSKYLDKFYSKLRHSGGLSKQEKNIQEEVTSIFASLKNLDLDIQNNLQSLSQEQLNDLLNTVNTLNDIKKQNSGVNHVINKIKILLSELEELETISTEIELLDNYITPSKKAIVHVEYDMAEEKLWNTFTSILQNLQNEEIISRLGDYNESFTKKIDELRRDWILWKDFKEVSRFVDLNLKNLIEEFIDFKLFRKNKISLLKKKPLNEFFQYYQNEFSKILDFEIQDLYFAGDGSENHLMNLRKLGLEIQEKLENVIKLQNSIEDNMSRLSTLELK